MKYPICSVNRVIKIMEHLFNNPVKRLKLYCEVILSDIKMPIK